MNDHFYSVVRIFSRLFGFGVSVATMAFCSGALVFAYTFILSFGIELHDLPGLALRSGVISIITILGHGSLFGWALIRIPAILPSVRFINASISVNPEPHVRHNLSDADLQRLLVELRRLPAKNGMISAIAVSGMVLSVLLYVFGENYSALQKQLIGAIGLVAILLHGSVTLIFSELAVSRMVSECRREILQRNSMFREPNSSSIRFKFIILGQAFVTALFNLFAITYFTRGNLQTVVLTLVYGIFFMSVVGYLVLYRISTSLAEIRQAATNLRDGANLLTYSKSLDAEFVDIADGLNSATLAIQDHQQNLENRIIERTKELSLEKDKSDHLLRNILPDEVANELKQKGHATPREYKSTTVLFTDFVGFTRIAESMTATELVRELDQCFSYFDNVAHKYGLEKLKTIGDAYMAAGGIPVKNNTHPFDCALAALEIQAFMNQMKDIKEQQGFPYWELRLGMHTGPLVAGVVGEKKFAYDVWGDTVNTASRMESSGVPGAINISRELRDQIHFLFQCEYRGKVHAKNKGEIEMYFLKGIKPKFSVSGEGRVPSEEFKGIYTRVKQGARLAPRVAAIAATKPVQ